MGYWGKGFKANHVGKKWDKYSNRDGTTYMKYYLFFTYLKQVLSEAIGGYNRWIDGQIIRKGRFAPNIALAERTD